MSDDTIDKIRNELKLILEKKSSKSLRQMAKRCGLDPSQLSKFIRGKRRFSNGKLLALVETYKLSLGLQKELLRMLDVPSHKGEIDFADAELFNEWFFYPLLELVRIRNRVPNIGFAAKAFDVSEAKLSLAIEKLIAARIIKTSDSGKMTVDFKICNTYFNKTSDILKKNQIDIAQLSKAAIERWPLYCRHHASTSLGFDVTQIPLVRLEIKKFQNRMCQIADKSKKLNAVYQMQIGFFPLLFL